MNPHCISEEGLEFLKLLVDAKTYGLTVFDPALKIKLAEIEKQVFVVH